MGVRGRHATAQLCVPDFSRSTAWGPLGVKVLGTWDFDGDGRADLLVELPDATVGFGSVHVALGSGGGDFMLGPEIIDTFGYAAAEVAVGDFDGDGVLDLVAVQYDIDVPRVVFLKGDGHGGFREESSFRANGLLGPVVPGDFDGDGHLDLVAIANSQYVWWYRGDGRGGLTLVSSFAAYPTLLAVLDADGDGRDEILAPIFDSWPVRFESLAAWRLGSGGMFERLPGWPRTGGHDCPGEVAVGDVDGDGLRDAVTVSGFYDCVDAARTYLVRRSGGVLLEGVTAPLIRPVLADFDGDGKTDLAALLMPRDSAPPMLSVQRGDGAGHFGPAVLSTLPIFPSYSAALTAVDIEGFPDLIYSPVYGPAQILHNSCRGTRRRALPGPPVSPRPRPTP
jgi:hypothetical protein